jgi:O-antigen ligase
VRHIFSSFFTLKNTVRALFLLLIVSLGFMHPFVYTAGQRLTPTDLIFPAAAILWIVSLLFGQLKFKWHNFYWVLGGYFAAMLISAAFSADAKTSFIKLIGETYLIGLGVLTFNLIDDERGLKWALRAWLCGAALAATAGILTIFLFYLQPGNPLLAYTVYHYGAVPVGNYPRVSSTFISASMFCNYLNVSLVMLFIVGKRGWIGKTLFLVLLAAILICSVFTISAGLGGVFLSIGIWIWLMLRSRTDWRARFARFALCGGIAIAVLFFALNFIALQNYPGAPYAYKLPGIEAEVQPSSRLLVWSNALGTFFEHPFTGRGLGQAVSSVMYQNTDGSMSLLTDAHNIFLSVAAQCGIPGLLAILVLVFYILRLGSGFDRATFDQNVNSYILQGLGLAFLSAFVYQGLTGSFEDARHLWVLMGMIPAAASLYDERSGIT